MRTKEQRALLAELEQAAEVEHRAQAQIAALKQESAEAVRRQVELACALKRSGVRQVDAAYLIARARGIKPTPAAREHIARELRTRIWRVTGRDENRSCKPHNCLERGKARVTIDCANQKEKERQMDRCFRKRTTTVTEEQWIEDVEEVDTGIDDADETDVGDDVVADDAPAVHGAPDQRWPERHK